MSFDSSLFISQQRVLDTHDKIGVKVFDQFWIDFLAHEMYNQNTFYLYETFPNGSDWFYENPPGQNRKMHRFNGYVCTVNVTRSNGEIIHSKTYNSTPTDHPTWDGGGQFASFSLDISSKERPADSLFQRNQPVLYLPELDVYTFHLDYGTTKKASFTRISGKELDHLGINDVIVIEDGTIEIKRDFYQGPNEYTINGKKRILYDIHSQQRHIITL